MNPPAIAIDDLWFDYPDGTPALRGINLEIAAGEAVGLVGGNGAGKSTLLLQLIGCLSPARGSLRVGGRPVARGTLAEVRRAVGMVFQDPDDQLFMPTVFDDVAFGPLNQGLARDEIEARVAAALACVGMGHLRERPPHRLSGGEKRSVAIATALAQRPDVLVLDEPSSNLDPRARRRLIGWLQGFPCTRIIATHDLELVVETCTRVLVLDGGHLVAAGPVREILGDIALMDRHGLESPHILRHLHPH
jgi:cobalt/nickel transport system ATP-binding protein